MPKKLTKIKQAPPDDRQTGKKSIFSYSIKDSVFGEFSVLNSANAWWLEKTKVYNLISVFKLDGTIEEACSYAGITKRQYDYFTELHPEFCSVVIENCRQLPALKARQTVVSKMDENYSNAMDYLSRKKKAEFSTRQEMSGPDGKDLFAEAIKKVDDLIASVKNDAQST